MVPHILEDLTHQNERSNEAWLRGIKYLYSIYIHNIHTFLVGNPGKSPLKKNVIHLFLVKATFPKNPKPLVFLKFSNDDGGFYDRGVLPSRIMCRHGGIEHLRSGMGAPDPYPRGPPENGGKSRNITMVSKSPK